jgi:peptidyl-prolyl cis-trans isomerase SurA
MKASALLSAMMCLVMIGCSPSHETIVATVGEEPITMSEYEHMFIKSNGSRESGIAATDEEREKFLGLMTKYKLKLADAYDHQLDRDPAIIAEINQYRGSLAASFLTEREVTTPGVRRMYERRKEELRASHILLSLSPKASPEDSATAYKDAYDIIGALRAGVRFDSLAIAFSRDPSVRQNHGDLYYFTSGQMVKEFEDAAFGMKPGQVSDHPVRTQYGLHIIKITDRKPAPGEIRVSHIMTRFQRQNPSPEDTLAAFQAISKIKDSLAMGFDFAELAKRNSGDPGSASNGGDLGWFQRRRWIQPFDEAAFNLKPGETSGIVRTVYGYHLIRCTDARPPKSFEEARKDLEQAYQQFRFQDDYAAYVNKLKAHMGYALDSAAVARFIAALDSTKNTKDSAWAEPAVTTMGKRPVITVGGRMVSIDSLVSMITIRPDLSTTPLRKAQLTSAIEKIGEQVLFEERAKSLEKESPEFANIMKEYREGILLYEIEQQRVWKRIEVNDSALAEYFRNNREKFVFPDRLDISEIHVTKDSVAQAFHASLLNGETMAGIASWDSVRMAQPTKFPIAFRTRSSSLTSAAQKSFRTVATELQSDPGTRVQVIARPDTVHARKRNKQTAQQRLDAIAKHLSVKSGLSPSRITTTTQPLSPSAGSSAGDTVTVEILGRRAYVLGPVLSGLYPVDLDARTTTADSLEAGSYSRPFLFKGILTIVRLNGHEPSRQKSFEEAGTEVSSAFQEYESKRLESEWLNSLRKRYPVVEHPEQLKRAFVTASK